MKGWQVCVALLVLTACFVAYPAHGEPYYGVRQGLKCASCHENPAGGGIRNAFGNTWAQGVLAAETLAAGDSWTGALGKYVSIGSNLRANASYLELPHQSTESAFDVEEARLYLALNAVPERLSLYLDQRVAPGGSENLEAYGRLWWGNRSWYVQGGQMYLPYGLRLEDDSAFIRQTPGINFSTPDQGLQLGYESAFLSAQLAVSNGTAAGPETDKGKQWSARMEYVRAGWRAGASANFNDADAGDRRMGNVFLGVRTGPIAWLAEADYVSDKSSSQGERNQWVGHLEGNWEMLKGHNLKLAAEYLDPDDDVDEDEQNRYSAVWEYVPLPFLQLRLGARVYDGIPQNDQQNRRLAFLQLHAFF